MDLHTDLELLVLSYMGIGSRSTDAVTSLEVGAPSVGRAPMSKRVESVFVLVLSREMRTSQSWRRFSAERQPDCPFSRRQFVKFGKVVLHTQGSGDSALL